MDISPDKQNIDRVFSNVTYHIDFYQRDYKWTEEPVERLLDDVFYKFDQEYETKKDLDASIENISRYSWYYLNTYVTNTINGKVFVVDGQQRLTTLTLILIKLHHMAKKFESKRKNWLQSKIVGYSVDGERFWMNHQRHIITLQGLYNDEDSLEEIDTKSGVTAKNMVNNYKMISSWLDKKLGDHHRFETFLLYFTNRLVLINLSVEQTDVPMVFEVINDRGVSLKPYEIIKGKLLGQVDKGELEQKGYNELWEKQVNTINEFKDDEIDTFFRNFLKAKFSDTRKEGTLFDGDYHREMFNHKLGKQLHILHDSQGVKGFLEKEFTYYTNLYKKLRKAYIRYDENYPHMHYNAINDLHGQFMLILSACKINDSEEDEKVRTITYELDRLFALLQLQNVYDSNSFASNLYLISAEIREKPLDAIRPAFDKYLMKELSERRSTEVNNPLQYAYFRNTGINLNTRFKRYFFGRIEHFMAQNLNQNMVHDVHYLTMKTGPVHGYHIEHILSYNDENHALFEYDDERFEQERNRLGGILLLKGRDNISSGNETFQFKLKTYAGTLLWNESLRADSYKSKLDMKKFKEKYSLELEPYNQFGPEELEKRQKLLFKMAKVIWS